MWYCAPTPGPCRSAAPAGVRARMLACAHARMGVCTAVCHISRQVPPICVCKQDEVAALPKWPCTQRPAQALPHGLNSVHVQAARVGAFGWVRWLGWLQGGWGGLIKLGCALARVLHGPCFPAQVARSRIARPWGECQAAQLCPGC